MKIRFGFFWEVRNGRNPQFKSESLRAAVEEFTHGFEDAMRVTSMSEILSLIKNHRVRQFDVGEIVLQQGQQTGLMYVLLQGDVEVLRDDVRVATASQPGAVFGEMSMLLGSPHTATVRAQVRSSFAVVENPRLFLEGSAQGSLFVAELLAHRLDALNKYLIDVKRQYEGHDHLGMVDEVLETLMHRQPRSTAR